MRRTTRVLVPVGLFSPQGRAISEQPGEAFQSQWLRVSLTAGPRPGSASTGRQAFAPDVELVPGERPHVSGAILGLDGDHHSVVQVPLLVPRHVLVQESSRLAQAENGPFDDLVVALLVPTLRTGPASREGCTEFAQTGQAQARTQFNISDLIICRFASMTQ